jgi:hypothetical protein
MPALSGTHAPLTHELPLAQLTVAHDATHWPSEHTRSAPHSLANWQTFAFGVHPPAWHTLPALHWASVPQGQGPLSPPHATHAPETHARPTPQLLGVVHLGTPPLEELLPPLLDTPELPPELLPPIRAQP